ncbi:MAG: hypothetical protein M1816_001632 [Peltula sp. TS41687]|nr:MAG: hypothetical protein M1816_001632 [Peltula sp. TS41687]
MSRLRLPASKDGPTETSPLLQKDPEDTSKADISTQPVITNTIENVSAQGGQGTGDEESQEEDTRNYEGMPEIQKKMKYIVPALAIGVFLSAVDQTLIVSSYGRIGSDLNALNNTSWIATAYYLTLVSFQPLYGKLSDIFGRKPALLSAYTLFGLGCLFCGLARNMTELIAARAFAGIGGGGMTTVVSILLSDIVALRDRGTYQGYVNIVYATGAGLGAPVGGAIADYIGWRWAFLCQPPIALLAIITVYFALHMPIKDDAGWKKKLGRIDFLGASILVATVLSLLLGLDRGSNVAWRDATTLGLLCTSLVLLVLFIFAEIKVAAEPFAPGHIIFERSLFACYLCNFFSFGGWLAAIFYIPLFYQAVDGLSATQAGVRLLPAIIAGVSGSLFAGILMKKTGRYYWLTVAAYTLLLVGFIPILLFTGLVVKSTWGISVGTAICGFGNGIGVTSSLVALISEASTADQAVATACSYLFRSMGSVLGVSLSSTVVQQSLRVHLRQSLGSGKDADEIVKGVRRSLDFLKSLSPEKSQVVRNCYGKATQAGFILNTCVVAGATISAFWIKEKRLSR